MYPFTKIRGRATRAPRVPGIGIMAEVAPLLRHSAPSLPLAVDVASKRTNVALVFSSATLLALASGLGFVTGGLLVLGNQWEFKDTDGAMHWQHTCAVGMVLFGISASLLLGGLALSHLGLALHEIQAARCRGPRASVLFALCPLVFALTVSALVAWAVVPLLQGEIDNVWSNAYDAL